jgi:copper chaperone CopZ
MNAKTIHFIAACAILTGATGTFGTAQAATSVKVRVNGMVCAFCAQGIEKRLSKLPATQSVFVDLKQKVVAVQAREGQSLDVKTVSAEIVDAGYDVVSIEAVAQSVAEIQAETKASAAAAKAKK